MKVKFLIVFLGGCFIFFSCEKMEVIPATVESSPQRPVDVLQNDAGKMYAFTRNKKSSVKNTGQTVRNILIQDLKILIESLAKPGASPITYGRLYRYYDNNRQTIRGVTLTQIHGELLIPRLEWISSVRDLKYRVNPIYGDSITSSIEKWCQIISQNSQDPGKLGTYKVYIDPVTGYDLAEMYQKTVLGGVNFSHGINTYLKRIEIRNNVQLVTIGMDTMNYTEKEHHFDEVFGYAGMSRNFLDFTDKELANDSCGTHYKDNVELDGKIDFRSEYNFYFATEAARRDLASVVHTDFTQQFYDAFYFGREAIIANDDVSLLHHKQVILETWEEIAAATAIHHLNHTLATLDHLNMNPGESPEELYRQWSAMYTSIEALRYNYNNRFTQWEMVLEDYVNPTNVPWPKALVDDPSRIVPYQDSLRMVREWLRSTYRFSVENALAW